MQYNYSRDTIDFILEYAKNSKDLSWNLDSKEIMPSNNSVKQFTRQSYISSFFKEIMPITKGQEVQFLQNIVHYFDHPLSNKNDHFNQSLKNMEINKFDKVLEQWMHFIKNKELKISISKWFNSIHQKVGMKKFLVKDVMIENIDYQYITIMNFMIYNNAEFIHFHGEIIQVIEQILNRGTKAHHLSSENRFHYTQYFQDDMYEIRNKSLYRIFNIILSLKGDVLPKSHVPDLHGNNLFILRHLVNNLPDNTRDLSVFMNALQNTLVQDKILKVSALRPERLLFSYWLVHSVLLNLVKSLQSSIQKNVTLTKTKIINKH